MPSFIPSGKSNLISWANNFKNLFPEIGAETGFSAEEIGKAVAACEEIVFAVMLARMAKNFSRTCTAYQKARLATKSDGKTHVKPVLVMPDAPAAAAPPAPIGYLRKIVRRLKTRDNFDVGMGLRLRIVVAPRAAARSLNEATAAGKIRCLGNSVVRIDWRKGRADGIIVESKRGGEQKWTEIGRDLYSPFIDTRPPLEAGKPEIRYYRLVYMLDDKAVGNYSPIYTAVTIP